MAAKKGKPIPETAQEKRHRRAEKMLREVSDPSWTSSRPVEATPDAARSRDDYVPQRFRGAPDTTYDARGEPPPARPVPGLVQWAAARLIEQLKPLAHGSPHPLAWGVRRRFPKLPPFSLVDFVEVVRGAEFDTLGDGTRPLTEADETAVLKAYRAWAGITAEDTWRLVLAEELRAALRLRMHARARHELIRSVDGMPEAAVESAPTEALRLASPSQILARVSARSPPGTLPQWVKPSVIELGLEQATDARRGGGRGEKKKKSVEEWIDDAAKSAAMGQRKAHAKAKKER